MNNKDQLVGQLTRTVYNLPQKLSITTKQAIVHVHVCFCCLELLTSPIMFNSNMVVVIVVGSFSNF